MTRLTLLALVATLSGCGPTDPWLPFGDAPPTSLHGSWSNPATGHAVVFSESGRQVYHVLGDHCISDGGSVPQYELYRLDESGTRLSVRHYDYRSRPELLQAPQTLEKAAPFDAGGCLDAEDRVSGAALTSLILDTFSEYYAFFELRGVDWNQERGALEARLEGLESDSLIFETLRETFRPLGDGHLNLSGAGQSFNAGAPGLRRRLVDAWRVSGSSLSEGEFVGAWHRGILNSVYGELQDGSLMEGAAGALEWGFLSDSVGYLRVNRLSGFTTESEARSAQYDSLALAVDNAFNDLTSASRLVIDVALNGGGSDAAALLIVSAFADRPRDVFSYETPRSPPQIVRVTPRYRPETRPIVLISSIVTASAAESFVLMMRALPHVRHVGGTTRGGLSSLLPKPFPNGFFATLSYQTVRDSDGQVHEGRGIVPECAVELFPDSDIHGSFAAFLRDLADGRARCGFKSSASVSGTSSNDTA